MNRKEKVNGSKECVQIDNELKQVIIQDGEKDRDSNRVFTYDNVYDTKST